MPPAPRGGLAPLARCEAPTRRSDVPGPSKVLVSSLVASLFVALGGTAPPCFFRQAAPTTAQALSWAVKAGGFSSDNATGLLNSSGAAGPVKLFCQGASFSFYSAAGDAESTVSFVRVDKQFNHTV